MQFWDFKVVTNVESLRKQYPRFVYQTFDWKLQKRGLKITFDFLIEPDIVFRPEVAIEGVRTSQIKRVGERRLANLVFNLGMIEALSYWKATCSPEIVVRAGRLNREQIRWWKKVIDRGMGQFFYENKIDFTKPNFLKIISQDSPGILDGNKRHLTRSYYHRPTERSVGLLRGGEKGVLVPLGGGKDSIVTLASIIKMFGGRNPKHKGGGQKEEVICFALNPTLSIKKIIKKATCREAIFVHRKIDPKLLELNQKGFLNGHTPFTAYLSFLSVLCAALFDIRYIAFSNERSANEGNVKYLGRVINHQWSKTYQFEKMFRAYTKSHLAKEIETFSFLRPLYELQIAKLFSQLPQYFSLFVSCNKADRIERRGEARAKWCCQCPKCLSTFILLSPFLSQEQLIKIFGQDLLRDKKLKPILEQLIGERGVKPFECVGTIEEMRAALGFESQRSLREVLASWDKRNFLPKQFKKILKKYEREPFSLFAGPRGRTSLGRGLTGTLKNKEILILGLGREGESTLRYLRRVFPAKTLGVADQLELNALPQKTQALLKRDKKLRRHLGPEYLGAIKNYDLIIKTPGIPIQRVAPHLKKGQAITSQTEIFFKEWPGPIVGVTGTKGKSTTAALIHHLLREAGFKTHLVGNIGKPALSYLPRAQREDIFVYELSSHQLLGLEKSPRVAVLLAIYREHLDYYKNFKAYVSAKANITRGQERGDYLVYDARNKEARAIARGSKAKKIPLAIGEAERLTKRAKIALPPGLYLKNVAAALEVAKLFGGKAERTAQALKSFQPLAHRLEFVGQFKGVRFYNDSLATIPEATIEAMRTLGRDVQTIILGGFDRGLAFKALAKALGQSKVKTIILFPESGSRIWRAILSQNKRVNLPHTFMVTTMRDAVFLAYQYTQKGKICLLSPASPSFGLFKDYRERGRLFKRYVRRYRKGAGKFSAKLQRRGLKQQGSMVQ